MTKFQWHIETTTELATLLRQALLEKSAAIGTSTVYQITHEGREKVAVSLPDGQVLIIEGAETAKIKRRRVDPVKKIDTKS
jgi:hypothetical protein